VFERERDRVVGSLTRLLESVLIIVLGAVVAVIVAAILLPIFQASSFVE
jgi:type II secretory pathway component PulF